MKNCISKGAGYGCKWELLDSGPELRICSQGISIGFGRNGGVQSGTLSSFISLGKGPEGPWIIIDNSGYENGRQRKEGAQQHGLCSGSAVCWPSPLCVSRKESQPDTKMHLIFFFLLFSVGEANSFPPGNACFAEVMVANILSRAGFWELRTAWLMDAFTGFCKPGLKTILFNIPVWTTSPRLSSSFLLMLTSLSLFSPCLSFFQTPPAQPSHSAQPQSLCV